MAVDSKAPHAWLEDETVPFPVLLRKEAVFQHDDLVSGTVYVVVKILTAEEVRIVSPSEPSKSWTLAVGLLRHLCASSAREHLREIPIIGAEEKGAGRILAVGKSKMRLDDLVLEPKLERAVHNRIQTLSEKYCPEFRETSKAYGCLDEIDRRMILMHGKSGNGKSSLAEAIADALSAQVVRVSVPALGSSYHTIGERALKQVLDVVSASGRGEGVGLVAIFDEADEWIAKRGTAGSHRMYDNQTANFLNAVSQMTHGLMILTSNLSLEDCDSAVVTRSDVYTFGPATVRQKRILIERILVRDRFDRDLDISGLVENNEFSLREVKAICLEVIRNVTRRHLTESRNQHIEQLDFDEAIETVVCGETTRSLPLGFRS